MEETIKELASDIFFEFISRLYREKIYPYFLNKFPHPATNKGIDNCIIELVKYLNNPGKEQLVKHLSGYFYK